jgi:LmbE family N-acetylglucosaminyl deacetylase
MNGQYLADRMARDHLNSLVADAAASRRAKEARRARRALGVRRFAK